MNRKIESSMWIILGHNGMEFWRRFYSKEKIFRRGHADPKLEHYPIQGFHNV